MKNKAKKSVFIGNLERLGGKILVQHGAEQSLHGKGSRQHSVGSKRG